MDLPNIIGTQVEDSVRMECALRNLVEFIDGLTCEQLEHVPGLFDATRKARMVLPGDHMASSTIAPTEDRYITALRAIHELTQSPNGMSDSDIRLTVLATSSAALGL